MAEEKVVPHMTDLIKILRDESILKSFLVAINENKFDKEQATHLFMNLEKVNLNKETSKRYVGSLLTFTFIIEKETIHLSNYSMDYLKGILNYSDFILNCISRNVEWAYFLPDIFDIIDKSGHEIKKKDIILRLIEEGYDIPNKTTVGRYLSEILPVLEIAKIIEYKNNKASIGKRNRKEVISYARVNRKELLKMLLLAENRRTSKPKFRMIYRAAVKAHLPIRRKGNKFILKTQKQLEEIRAIDFTKSSEKKRKQFDSKWSLTDPLWDWQNEFLSKWMENKKGIAKVVTGAGKTHLAMAIIQKMKEEFDDLHVTIIVPTIVLLEQWYENLIQKLQISPEEIGLKGGGYSDNFQNKRVLIVVINSAIKGEFIEKETNGIKSNLLIVDECHRAGSKEFSKIFKAKRIFELGLSATPEREMDDAFENILEKELGPIIGTYTYNDAREDNIIPKFNIYNYAVILTDDEKREYAKLTKEIQQIIQRLKYKYPQLNDPKIKTEIALKKLQKSYPNDRDLFLFFEKTKKRKNEILYPAKNRKEFVKNILEKVLQETDTTEINVNESPISVSKQDRVIVFHEIITEINSLFYDLDSPNVSIYHSGLPNSLNRIGLDLYRSGQTKILLSVKALIEGVDVPKTNIGIIMASSSSQTQRIQSLGRVLRKAKGKDKTRLFIVYVKNTTDERIYSKTNWDEIIGHGNIDFRMWTEFGEVPIEAPRIIQEKKYEDLDLINENILQEGCIYPGKYEGETFSFDSYGKLFFKTVEGRSYLDKKYSEVWDIYRKYKPSGGKLLINRLGHILIKYSEKEYLETIYLGNIKDYIDEFNTFPFKINEFNDKHQDDIDRITIH